MNNMEFPWPDGSWKEGDIDFLDNINLDLQLDELTAGAEFLDNVGFDHPDIPLPIIEPPKLNPIAAPTLSNSANSTTFPPKDPASKVGSAQTSHLAYQPKSLTPKLLYIIYCRCKRETATRARNVARGPVCSKNIIGTLSLTHPTTPLYCTCTL